MKTRTEVWGDHRPPKIEFEKFYKDLRALTGGVWYSLYMPDKNTVILSIEKTYKFGKYEDWYVEHYCEVFLDAEKGRD